MEHSRGQLGYSKAEKIKDAAKNTFGIKIAQSAFKFQLKQLIDKVLFIVFAIMRDNKDYEPVS